MKVGKKILAVYPHPDDETFGKAGTLIKHAASGDDITLICATMGQMGRRMGNPFFANRETLPDIREKELQAACAQIGIEDVRMWKMQDKTLQFRDQAFLADKIRHVIEEIKPDILYTFYPHHGVHPDHDAISQACVLAVSKLPKEWRPTIYGSVITKDPEAKIGTPDMANDVSDVLDEKLLAMYAHRSQSELVIQPIKENIRKHPEQKEQYLKPFKQEKFWMYSLGKAKN